MDQADHERDWPRCKAVFPVWRNQYAECCIVVVVDSHIQRIVLATEETTATQQVSHRPIKCQSRLWSQRGTKDNGSHHGDNPLLRPTGIQTATKSYAALQAMAPTNIKTVHQTSFLHIHREQPRSTRNVVAYPRPAFSAKNRKITLQPVLINKSKILKATHCTEIRKVKYRGPWNGKKTHGGGGLELVKPAREPASSRPKPCASLKKPHESCPFVAPCGPRRKKNDDRGQTSAFPSETSRFKPVILAHRGSALPCPGSSTIELPSAFAESGAYPPDRELPALRDSAPCLSRAATLPKGTKLGLGTGAHLGTPSSSANHTAAGINRQAESRRQPVGCIS